ncbi:glycosyltransferase family A protein [Pseudomonas alcaligenes]|jgi:glycosyltransferase involved in cell wall biosynthesis|uniref:glycosyltransferase family 2 protein n=1 Tax=Pseudomonadaceae TaxID=135621 RepID=UPI0014728F0D|nr:MULTISPECIES: glycosyltransferase family A protein [Pseudomonas]MEE1948895.1 glycosyltransferase family A protein [Pseudomonas alcaligenes]NMY42774.1 glycosyltransferase family 2 protein [Pseudomonas sp. WS 5013]
MSIFHRIPRLSIVLIVYKMPDQAEKTLYSLSPAYQEGISESDYEVIVVENRSDRLLGERRATQYAGNVRYHLRHETTRSPVSAINFGAEQATGSHLAIMIDGARMVTPGVVRLALDAFRMSPQAAVSAPGYHIGHKLQQVAVNEGYDEKAEARLLRSIDWPKDGYRLFDIAVLSGSCQGGFFRSNYESNFIAMSVRKWQAVGGMDVRYDDFGGGMANLDLYKRLLEYPDTPFYLLFGEGSFHQFHGGVTTGTLKEERDRVFEQIKAQDQLIRGDRRDPPSVTPVLFGTPHPSVYRFIRYSLDKVDPQ